MGQYKSYFQCISEQCNETFSLTDIVYRCPRCENLLEVKHDINALKKTTADDWMHLFDDRYMRTRYPYGSGVWGKKEWVYPNISDENIVSIYEGGTNLFWAERFGDAIGLEDLWIKQCGNSHTGSFKDLGMTVLVSAVKQMISNGANIHAVICASTGDTSASVASYCAAAGIPAVVLLPKNKVSTPQLIQPLANGAITLALDTDFDGCMEIISELSLNKNFYLANSVNPLRIEGQKTVSIETVQQDDWVVPDWIIVPSGNLGNVTAIGLGFKMMKMLGLIKSLPRIIAAQAANASPLYKSFRNQYKTFQPVEAQSTAATAIQIGNPVSYNRAFPILREFNGIVEQATEDELSHAAALADKHGMFCCPQTGVALACMIKLVNEDVISPKDKVIVLSTASGLKFPEFKVNYHEGQLNDVNPRLMPKPIELPGKIDNVLSAINKLL